MNLLRPTLGVKVFISYLIISSGIAWYLVDSAPDKLSKGIDKAAEEVMIDTANLLAQTLTFDIENDQINIEKFDRITSSYLSRKFDAKIYDFAKNQASLQIYITNLKGQVIYDSTGRYVGEDFSRDNDVYLTLKGKYGSRSSAYDRDNKNPTSEEKAFYVAAPIYHKGARFGSLTVVKQASKLRAFSITQEEQIEYYAMVIFLISLLFGLGISLMVSRSTKKLIKYTTSLSKGENVASPNIRQAEFSDLSKAIEKLRAELEDKEYIEEFISIMAHEIRSPITGIRLTAETLLLPMDDKQRTHFIKNILDANSRMDLLVSRILDLSKLERRDALDNVEKMSVKRLIKNVLNSPTRKGAIKSKSIEVKFDIENDAKIEVEAILAEQAISNIVDNAISFTPKGSSIQIKVRESNHAVQINVSDEGQGIPDYALGRIFTRFYSVARPDTGKRGTGLGLRFVKKIMNLHGGSVTLKNRFMKKEGAEAVLKFPIKLKG